METAKHRDQMTLLIDALRTAWKDRTDFYTGGNMFFYYSELQSKKNDYRGPDFFVVLDTDQRPRKSWVVWEEDGRRPDVIVELTSESTKTIDYVDKKALYARLSIAEYFIFDPEDGKLDGFTLDLATRSYTPIAPDARGWLWSGCLGLFLGVARMRRGYDRHEDLWLRFFDRDGEILPTSSELAIALDGRADEERQRADEERQRADEERQRADEERQRAEAEA
ncbi:Uma2 family endonuclease, partial [Myxococcota bacterium]|nr:Uma2 family endonuclease [Myxococcota bacterium]